MKFEDLRSLFTKIRAQWDEDSKIDFEFRNKQYTADLAQISLDIPFQHNKYLNHYTDLSQIKTSLEFELRKLVREKREYYAGEAPGEVYAKKPFGKKIKTNDMMKVHLESDEDIINIEAKVQYVNQMLNWLDHVMKQISNRSHHIRHAIDWERFINGSV